LTLFATKGAYMTDPLLISYRYFFPRPCPGHNTILVVNEDAYFAERADFVRSLPPPDPAAKEQHP